MRQRGNERVHAEVPVLTEEGAEGMTRDISPSGVYFSVDRTFRVGETVRFSIDFDAPAHTHAGLHLTCVGTVVRVENANGETGVAVAITESTLERREASPPVRAATAG